VLDDGRRAGELEFAGTAASMAALIVSSLEGAMIVARGSGDAQHFDDVARRLLDQLRSSRGKAARRAG
jgi:TetR/AcrR family transcriptional repressor of nem operon